MSEFQMFFISEKFVVSAILCIFARHLWFLIHEQELLQTGFHVNHCRRMNVIGTRRFSRCDFFSLLFYASSNPVFLSFRQTIIVCTSLFVPLPHLTWGNPDQGNFSLNHTQHQPTKCQHKIHHYLNKYLILNVLLLFDIVILSCIKYLKNRNISKIKQTQFVCFVVWIHD